VGYINSLLDTSYTVFANERDIVERLRRELRTLISDERVVSTFESQRSILSDAILNISNDLDIKYEEIFTSSLTAAIVTLLEATEGMTETQAAAYYLGDGQVNYNIVRQKIDSMAETIESLTLKTQDVVNSTGVLSESFKNTVSTVVLVGVAGKLALGVASVGTWLTIGATTAAVYTFTKGLLNLAGSISEEGIGQGLQSFWNGNVKPFFSNVFSTVSNTATRIWQSFIAPVGGQLLGGVVSLATVQNYSPTISISPITDAINQISSQILNQGIPQTLFDTARFLVERGIDLAGDIGNIVSEAWKDLLDVDLLRNSGISGALEQGVDFLSTAGSNVLNFITAFLPSSEAKNIISAVGQVLSVVAPNFEDGVTETRFGRAMENSWGTFLNELFAEGSSLGVNIIPTTPLDPSFNENETLYGNMMLGAPLRYTRVTDPNNRNMINTFVKDSVFLSLTPGMPKYNGGAFQQEVLNLFSQGVSSSYLNQTPTASEMRDYLFRNGLDEYFGNKDKRYYVFQSDYEEYFAYLETMLNTLWVKMGLGTNEDGSFNIFTFFDDAKNNLSSRFRSSIGFFINPTGISEGLSNQTLSTDLGEDANAASSQFQRLNYITGMGTAGTGRNIMRQIGVAGMQAGTLGNILRQNLSFEGSNIFQRGASLVSSVIDFANTQDMSSLVQQFQVTNGMKVQYPQLWESSGYTKNMTFDFSFVSPYGDPLSIFQYVYVPFFSLLAFVMPRQAAENGLVSPFFVRADIPGWMTSDLALITDLVWTKTLWTKDKLPREISGNFTITDLYPYLASVKRLSFLSANPSYTVFLDNMAGLRSLYNDNINTDPFSEYWDSMINRVNGDRKENNTLFNDYSNDRKFAHNQFARTNRESLTRTINKKSAPWLSKI
jgi:hypothetical protein